ncbi:MAG: hypothetical protein Q7R49_05605 [Candidatus Daviesbacteria bacterium]|nr:hypothetical protein [Candidatus Daviesbacteria bacterium]
MLDIIIDNPRINTDERRGFSYSRDKSGIKLLSLALESKDITPSSHPTAADLCAGDGSWARMLLDHGWDESNLTCIDSAKSPTPLVPGANWLYWDLEALSTRLFLKKSLPEEILSKQHTFDIVFTLYTPLTRISEETMGIFLIRPGGYIFNHSHPLGKLIS